MREREREREREFSVPFDHFRILKILHEGEILQEFFLWNVLNNVVAYSSFFIKLKYKKEIFVRKNFKRDF